MPLFDDDLDLTVARARAELLKKPGALGVCLGYKQRAGVVTDERSWVVFVRQKKALAELAPADVVPRELFGIPTDVLTAPPIRKLACPNHDKFEILEGGLSISNLKRYTATGSLAGDEFGTLGFFGTLNSSSSRDNIVGLSNNHVIAANGAARDDLFYQPRRVGSTLAREDMHPIGKIENVGKRGNHTYNYAGDPAGSPTSFWVDAATIHINTDFSSCCNTNKGVKFRNLIHDLRLSPLGNGAIDGIARVRDIDVASATPDYKVYKAGETTGWTTGKLFTAKLDYEDPVDGTRYDTLLVITNATPNCGGGTAFAGGGDSGSVIVNSDRKIIGLLIGELMGLGGYYVGCHIHPVSDYLGITMLSSTHLAGAEAGGAMLEREVGLADADPDMVRALALRDEIVSSERGRRYHDLVMQHRPEVVHLVNHVRPVTVAWHRIHGPDFLGHVVHASRHAHHKVPRELQGVTRDEALTRILQTLAQHGSASLRAAIEQHRDEVQDLFVQVDDIEALAEEVRDTRTAERVP